MPNSHKTGGAGESMETRDLVASTGTMQLVIGHSQKEGSFCEQCSSSTACFGSLVDRIARHLSAHFHSSSCVHWLYLVKSGVSAF